MPQYWTLELFGNELGKIIAIKHKSNSASKIHT